MLTSWIKVYVITCGGLRSIVLIRRSDLQNPVSDNHNLAGDWLALEVPTTKVCRDVPQSLQATAGSYLKLGEDHFLPHL